MTADRRSSLTTVSPAVLCLRPKDRRIGIAVAVLFGAIAFSPSAGAQEISDSAAIHAQGWTGSLIAPSPAIPVEGRMAVEPYFLDKRGAGTFDNNGELHSSPPGNDQSRSFTSLQYGVTDKFSVQIVPAFAHTLSGGGAFGFSDLPVRVKYRWFNGALNIWQPSLTTTMGLVLPVGHFENLRKASEGFGGGAVMAQEQVLLQSVFFAGGYLNRMRLWGTLAEPLTTVSLHGISSYGTGPGFVGTAVPGSAAELGIADEFAIDSRWVLALDVVQTFAKGTHLHTLNNIGSVPDVPLSGFSITPAFEYNFSTSIGVIAGVQLSTFGRNSSSTVAPQLAVNMFFD